MPPRLSGAINRIVALFAVAAPWGSPMAMEIVGGGVAPLQLRQRRAFTWQSSRGLGELTIHTRGCERDRGGAWIDWLSVRDFVKHFHKPSWATTTKDPEKVKSGVAVKGLMEPTELVNHYRLMAPGSTTSVVSNQLAVKVCRSFGCGDEGIQMFLRAAMSEPDAPVRARARDALEDEDVDVPAARGEEDVEMDATVAAPAPAARARTPPPPRHAPTTIKRARNSPAPRTGPSPSRPTGPRPRTGPSPLRLRVVNPGGELPQLPTEPAGTTVRFAATALTTLARTAPRVTQQRRSDTSPLESRTATAERRRGDVPSSPARPLPDLGRAGALLADGDKVNELVEDARAQGEVGPALKNLSVAVAGMLRVARVAERDEASKALAGDVPGTLAISSLVTARASRTTVTQIALDVHRAQVARPRAAVAEGARRTKPSCRPARGGDEGGPLLLDGARARRPRGAALKKRQ